MIYVDFNQAVIAAVSVHPGPEFHKGQNADSAFSIARHLVLNMLLSYKKKYGKKYGQIVIATDDSRYWRRTKYWWYKGHRKYAKDDSPLDWSLISNINETVSSELAEHFPYKVISVRGAEADDIIGCLVKYSQTNELVTDGVFLNVPQPSLILSSDQDFGWLQEYENVSQYSPAHKKPFVVDGDLNEFKIEHIVKGDTGDNIPNVLTPIQWSIDRANGVKPKKQVSMTAARLASFKRLGRAECRDDFERENYDRNTELVSFDSVPDEIREAIISSYVNYQSSWNRSKTFAYLVKHKIKTLIDEAANF